MDTDVLRQKLTDNFNAVEERIEKACARAGRQRSEVTLVAVTKNISVELAAHLPTLRRIDLGENRPQELWRKAEILPKDVRWHLIGHLQRNKIEKTLPLVQWIHSIDSVRLLQALDEVAVKQQCHPKVLLEVNASGEGTKQGFAPSELAGLAPIVNELTQLLVCGLMTMAAPLEPEACRPTFATLRRLRDELRPKLAMPDRFNELSMGMSNDFEIAIEEGATLIRLGTVLFEGPYQPRAQAWGLP